ncbi:MAG: SAVED domain-containing protein [Oscillospiraceae bacterium]|nr:SAVED domain-containing protein [Oscillospiraceae bacterium]
MANFIIVSGVALLLDSLIMSNEFGISVMSNLLGIDSPNLSVTWTNLAIGVIMIIIGIWLQNKLRQRIYVFNMYGVVPRDISDEKAIHELKIAEYKLKEHVVNIFPILKAGCLENGGNKAICDHIEHESHKFSNRAANKATCYTGMAPLPYTVFAGTCLASANIQRYLEFNRNDGERFYELKPQRWWNRVCLRSWQSLEVESTSNILSDASEVVLAISITSRIADADLTQFGDINVVRIGLAKPADNVITCIQRLMEYNQAICDCIETTIKKMLPNLDTVNIVASIPSCVALELGKNIARGGNRLTSIAVYHFEAHHTPKYKYGVYVNGSKKGNLVQ